jgi:hypothetical protein
MKSGRPTKNQQNSITLLQYDWTSISVPRLKQNTFSDMWVPREDGDTVFGYRRLPHGKPVVWPLGDAGALGFLH